MLTSGELYRHGEGRDREGKGSGTVRRIWVSTRGTHSGKQTLPVAQPGPNLEMTHKDTFQPP